MAGGFGDDPALVDVSLRKARRRVATAAQN